MRVPLWDLPVRLFHWALAALVVFSFVTGHLAGSWLPWHMRSGYAILALLVFRIAWGLLGSETARFSHFLHGPRAAIAYARATFGGAHRQVVGHNPLGGWMVFAMLAIALLQAVSGLFVDDEISTQGPLAGKVSNAVVARMGALHHLNQWVVVGAVVLHVLAILYYHRVLRVNLVGPMVHGMAELAPGVAPPRQASLLRAIILGACASGFVYWLVMVYPRAA